MRRSALSLCLFALLATAAAAQQPQPVQTQPQPGAAQPGQGAAQPADPIPESDRDKASYFLGINLANNLLAEGMDVDPAWLYRGVVETLAGKEPSITQQELIDAVNAFRQEMMVRKAEQDRIVGERNLQQGAEFFAQNKDRPGVVSLPSGLQYQVIEAGAGPKPKPTDVVRVHYRGQLLDGREFDTSYDTGEPVEFGVNQVIDGWTEALQLMPTGSKWRLFIPSALAYENRSNGPIIGPNATLVFDVELLAIVGGGAADP